MYVKDYQSFWARRLRLTCAYWRALENPNKEARESRMRATLKAHNRLSDWEINRSLTDWERTYLYS